MQLITKKTKQNRKECIYFWFEEKKRNDWEKCPMIYAFWFSHSHNQNRSHKCALYRAISQHSDMKVDK